MAATFSVDPTGFLILRTNKRGDNTVSLSELLNITQNLSLGETHHDAIDLKRISIKMVCNFSKQTYDLLDESQFNYAGNVVKDVIENESVNVPYVIMFRDRQEHIVCKISFNDEKPYWQVVRSGDFTHRELSYYVNILKHAGILSLSKRTAP